MSFYDLPKPEREKLVARIHKNLLGDITHEERNNFLKYFSDEDTYIRKSAYLSLGRIYFAQQALQKSILALLKELYEYTNEKIRQTAINAAGEIGIYNFAVVEGFFDTALFDAHHIVRNAVIGSIKKMGEKNPAPVLEWARKYLHHPDKEIRREICHGIELRGRTHPEDILPLLKELQHDETARVRNTLVHVLGQIAYKKGCIQTVIAELKSWENKELVKDAVEEIIDVHHRYRNFSYLTQEQARLYISENI